MSPCVGLSHGRPTCSYTDPEPGDKDKEKENQASGRCPLPGPSHDPPSWSFGFSVGILSVACLALRAHHSVRVPWPQALLGAPGPHRPSPTAVPGAALPPWTSLGQGPHPRRLPEPDPSPGLSSDARDQLPNIPKPTGCAQTQHALPPSILHRSLPLGWCRCPLRPPDGTQRGPFCSLHPAAPAGLSASSREQLPQSRAGPLCSRGAAARVAAVAAPCA